MKKYLFVIDMQNDFIDGSLGTKEAQAIVSNVKKKINEYASYPNSRIIYTMDTHYDNYFDTLEGKKLPVKHCVVDTDGWKIADGLYVSRPSSEIVVKNTFGAIERLREILNETDEEIEIEFVGLCTDICVLSNAIIARAILPNTKITVDSTCCAGVTPETHNSALVAMRMCQIDIV